MISTAYTFLLLLLSLTTVFAPHPYGQLFSNGGLALTDAGKHLLGAIHPLENVVNQLSFCGFGPDDNFGPVPPNLPDGFNFCWRCAKQIPRTFNRLICFR